MGAKVKTMTHREINKLIHALSVLKGDYKDMTINQALTFLLFGSDPDMTQGEVAQKLKVSVGTVSRIVDRLYNGQTGKLEGKGLNYVTQHRWESTDARRMDVILSPKGLEVWDRLETVLGKPKGVSSEAWD